MLLPKVQDAKIHNKNVVVRVDYNVALNKSGSVAEAYKIDVTKKTIDLLFEKGARTVSLITHIGQPKGCYADALSTKHIVLDAQRSLSRSVTFVEDCNGREVEHAIANAQQGDIFLLENVRFYPEEKKTVPRFAQDVARPFDVFVNDAFAVSHRNHASVVGICEFLPSFAGLALQKEIEVLSSLQGGFEKPAVAIIGGAKIKTKLPLIRRLEKIGYDVLVGGKIANEALDRKLSFSQRVHLPEDFRNDDREDIGSETIAHFLQRIATARTIVWNGPMGRFEKKPFDHGTRALITGVAANKNAFTVIGGGESVQALAESGRWNTINHVSTGGGAMLAFLSGQEMPGLIALVRSANDDVFNRAAS